MVTLSEIGRDLKSYNPHAEIPFLEKAYHFSEKVHEGQLRASGEPYVVHPLEVAEILTHMKLDVPSIAAGLLHDTVEDTLTSLEEIKKTFGLEVATLVDG